MTRKEKAAAETALVKLEKSNEKVTAKLTERDECIAEARRRAEDDRGDLTKVGDELIALYADQEQLGKHARVAGYDEVEENEFNLNIPRYVDTFEPEPRVEVSAALKVIAEADKVARDAEHRLVCLLKEVGYAAD
jgi:type I restriction enzyme M protein